MAVLEASEWKGKRKIIVYFFLQLWFSSVETWTTLHSCPILSNRFHPTKLHSICCRSENCISLAPEMWTKCCRFDRFVRFVKWKSLLSIRQVRSSIGQLYLISDNGDPVQDCRIDRFVRFVKWKSLLSIRQVQSSIGQLHLISDNDDPVQDCRIDRFVRLVGNVISFTILH